ncbi:MAG: DUF1127 domain-containing protein [Bauldia sp.]|nr:DUF1127 domain-containing protein [Bauldia sp.]
MATYDDSRHSSRGTLFVPLISALLENAIAVVEAIRHRRQVAKLLSWDAHMLRDIGLTEGDVRAAMAGPMRDDPSYRLDALVHERRRAGQALARERLLREGRARL